MIFLYNPVLIICILIILFCTIRGAQKGMLRIIFGMISWIILLWFVNTACTYVSDYLNVNTTLPAFVQENIETNLSDKYHMAEEDNEGTGEDAVLKLLPIAIREKVDETINNSVEALINCISVELSEAAIKGIATIVSVLGGILLIYILNKLINLIGAIPGIKGANKMLGVTAGFVESLLIIWLCMYLADCFPTTKYGEFILTNTASNDLLNYVYKINIIEQVFGI
ncbi:CvpA family protein [Pseudobutyrivibrio xylanivorans]|uniref:CvpA family protein n=2 Tax=Pseudobutyrivibrio xylanivorans TaxID=185007 RepID=A0A5P6VRA9_PSEXY|nr:CvpA family protein [Pseudobutyrivibrio xylanivorans]QFJ54219.1 CvpA family protein [Pseudobutyrivibrio xylanivorans]